MPACENTQPIASKEMYLTDVVAANLAKVSDQMEDDVNPGPSSADLDCGYSDQDHRGHRTAIIYNMHCTKFHGINTG